MNPPQKTYTYSFHINKLERKSKADLFSRGRFISADPLQIVRIFNTTLNNTVDWFFLFGLSVRAVSPSF
jgi:hypothetical protein